MTAMLLAAVLCSTSCLASPHAAPAGLGAWHAGARAGALQDGGGGIKVKRAQEGQVWP